MIYGEKFLNNTLLSESVLIREEENINLLINNIDTLFEVSIDDSLTKFMDMIDDKSAEIFDKIQFYIRKFIDLIKLKVLKLGNRILKKIDEVINGKFEEADLVNIEDDFKKDFDNGGEYKEIIESVITESGSERKVAFAAIKNPKSLSEKTTKCIADNIELADSFMELANKYLDDSIEFLKGNHSESVKNKLESYHDYFKKDVDEAEEESKKDDILYSLDYDLKELKSFKGKQDFTTSNDYFKLIFFNIYNKEELKELRSLLLTQINYLEKQVESLMKHQNELKKTYLKVKSFCNKSGREMKANGYFSKSYEYTRFEGDKKYKYIRVADVEDISKDLIRIINNDYKACNNLITASMYITKSNYKTAIQVIKLWGDNKPKE